MWKFGTYLDYKISDTNGKDELEFRPLFEKPMSRTTLTLSGVFDERVENWSEDRIRRALGAGSLALDNVYAGVVIAAAAREPSLEH